MATNDTTEAALLPKGRLCNFEEMVMGGGKTIEIVVPKIQRAYAQGRKREVNIREQFVAQILDTLAEGGQMELNFVYGANTSGGADSTFSLLDGQQRLTTLFLLYWYFAMAEDPTGAKMPEALRHFCYETRTTSTDFIKKLVDSKVDVAYNSPSETIRGRQWYTTAFDKDPTVEGMLTMLDTIHHRYTEMGRPRGMLANMANIRFYELDLNDFGLSEEIYIKMNARGLQLTPFENFKADLVKYMKDEANPNYKESVKLEINDNPEAPHYFAFSQKMDAKWTNHFWTKDDAGDNVYCDKFFRFFYRYLASKYFLEVKADMPALEFRPGRCAEWDFLWLESPKQSSVGRKPYLGFRIYKQIFDEHPGILYQAELLLDTLFSDDVDKTLHKCLTPTWDPTRQSSFFNEEYTLQDAVMFSAVAEFIEAAEGKPNTEQLRRWLRVAWNTTENQLFQNVNDMVSAARNLSAIIRSPGATTDVYGAMCNFSEKNDYPRSLREEIFKAGIIKWQSGEQWEEAFIEAESHPLFRGAIGFLLVGGTPPTPEDFRHRAAIVGAMFNAKGITPKLRQDHLLIMAMVRQLNSSEKMGMKSDGSVRLPITESTDATNHLKVLLAENKHIQRFMQRLGDLPTFDDAEAELHRAMEDDVEFTCTVGDDKLKGKAQRAFKRLAYDKKVYDFISCEEDSAHVLEFTYLEKQHFVVSKARTWYGKMFIESERNQIIPQVIDQLGYAIETERQAEAFCRYGDYSGYDVWLVKPMPRGAELHLDFKRGDLVRIVAKDAPEVLLCKRGAKAGDNGFAELCRVEYQTKADAPQIFSAIKAAEKDFAEAEAANQWTEE